MRSGSFDVIEVTICFDSPVAVGDPINYDVVGAFKAHVTPGSDPDAGPPDTPVVRDPRTGLPTLQGSSLMGALRHHLSGYPLPDGKFRVLDQRGIGAREAQQVRNTTRPTLADLVCGSLPEEVAPSRSGKPAGTTPARRPSALRMVEVMPEGTPAVDLGTRVAISRRSGAAVDSKLFTQEAARLTGVVALFTLDHAVLGDAGRDLSLDGSEVPAEDVVVAIVMALQEWAVQVGAHASIGQGRGRISHTRTRRAHLASEVGRLLSSKTTAEYFRNGIAPWQGGSAPAWFTRPENGPVELLNARFRLVDPLFIDPRPCQGGDRDNINASSSFVAGSAWKGVVRSRCEYILRSVGIAACLSSDAGTCGMCPTCRLFGWTPREGLLQRGADAGDGARSMLRFEDSPVESKSDDGSAGPALQWVDVDHVAIDRFTGGADDGKLFVERAIAPPAEVGLRIRSTRGQPVPEWAGPLLWFAVADMNEGLIGIGHSTTRGMGTLAVVGQDLPKMQQALLEWPGALAALREEYAEVSGT